MDDQTFYFVTDKEEWEKIKAYGALKPQWREEEQSSIIWLGITISSAHIFYFGGDVSLKITVPYDDGFCMVKFVPDDGRFCMNVEHSFTRCYREIPLDYVHVMSKSEIEDARKEEQEKFDARAKRLSRSLNVSLEIDVEDKALYTTNLAYYPIDHTRIEVPYTDEAFEQSVDTTLLKVKEQLLKIHKGTIETKKEQAAHRLHLVPAKGV